MKNKDETWNYLIEETNWNELMSKKKQEKVFTTLNDIKHFLILAFTVTGCFSISDFTFLIGIPIGIVSSAIELQIFAIAAGIKKYKSTIKKKTKKHNKIVLLTKYKLNSTEVLISKAIIVLVFSNDEFVLIIKQEIKHYCNK